MDPVIPLADLQPIYSMTEVGRAREDGAARRNEGLKSWYDRMFELGGSRYIIKPSTTAAVDDLCDASMSTSMNSSLKWLAVSRSSSVYSAPIGS